MRRILFLIFTVSFLILGCSPQDKSENAKAKLMAIADAYLEETLNIQPEIAYFVGLELPNHAGLTDNSAKGISNFQKFEEVQYKALLAIDEAALKGTPEWVLWGQMKEMLEASIGLRVCRQELWNVNHMGGFHSFLGQLAEMQPVGTPGLREQALVRWGRIDTFIGNEIANLRRGIEQGYLAPENAVSRVIQQVDGLLAVPEEQSPLFAPARKDDDAPFGEAYSAVIRDEVLPALTGYRNFLENEYAPHARSKKGVGANPNGRECYLASYRSYTTLKLSPEEVFERGSKIVEGYRAEVTALGREHYGSETFAEAVAANEADPANQIADGDQLYEIFRNVVARAEAASAGAFPEMPARRVEVKPYPDYLAGTGMSARYEQGQGEEPAVFRFDPATWDEQTLGTAERVSVHEAWPGHHMQIAYANAIEPVHEVQKLVFNSAYIEGWARYAEALAEELGVYSSQHAKITRRAWPARGMVVDPGVHVLGWSDEQAMAFLKESGGYDDASALRMLDRISVIPAQLTAYDSGATVIFDLRGYAEKELGGQFDLKEFHGQILGSGIVPLWMLQDIITDWVASKKS